MGHLVGILGEGDPSPFGICKVHVWSYQRLLDGLPDAPWLVKHNPPELERSLLHQAWWQLWSLPGEVRRYHCDILLSTDAGTVGNVRPSVVMSRDMLSYEPGEMRRYGFSKAWLRLLLLRYIQARSMKRAEGVIFLTKYAAETIQKTIGGLPNIRVIPHGVGAAFRQRAASQALVEKPHKGIHCLYVSNAAMYKHQWVVIRAIGELRRRGHAVALYLAGGGSGKAQRLLDAEIARTDPQREFVKTIGFVRHEEIPALLARADLFIFASSCENMPNTLVEAMASGLPIASSNRGPMPEVLKDGGVYFDPEDHESIVAAVQSIIVNRDLRARIARRARELSERYSWTSCARETWEFLRENVR